MGNAKYLDIQGAGRVAAYEDPFKKEDCHAQVWGDWHGYQCSRKGKYKDHGFLWCFQHWPINQIRRNADQDNIYHDKHKKSDLKWEKSRLYNEVAEVAIKYFQQKATHDELEAAVMAYEGAKR